MQITRQLAIQILKYLDKHPDFNFPFLVMNQEYTPEDDDFVEIEPNEWEMIEEDNNYKTFELWKNFHDLDDKASRLLAKGFMEEILSSENKIKNFIFYTTEGCTLRPNYCEGDSDVENCQILGWAKANNPKEAFELLKLENPWILNFGFEEVIASELKDEKTYYFNF
jgi:hypothetical protein